MWAGWEKPGLTTGHQPHNHTLIFVSFCSLFSFHFMIGCSGVWSICLISVMDWHFPQPFVQVLRSIGGIYCATHDTWESKGERTQNLLRIFWKERVRHWTVNVFLQPRGEIDLEWNFSHLQAKWLPSREKWQFCWTCYVLTAHLRTPQGQTISGCWFVFHW